MPTDEQSTLSQEKPKKRVHFAKPHSEEEKTDKVLTCIKEFKDHPEEKRGHYYDDENARQEMRDLTTFYSELKLILLFNLYKKTPQRAKMMLAINHIIKEVETNFMDAAINNLLKYIHGHICELLLKDTPKYDKTTNKPYRVLDWEKIEEHFSIQKHKEHQLPLTLEASEFNLNSLYNSLFPDCDLKKRKEEINELELIALILSTIENLESCDELAAQAPHYFPSDELNQLYIICQIIRTEPTPINHLSEKELSLLRQGADLYIQIYEGKYPEWAKMNLYKISIDSISDDFLTKETLTLTPDNLEEKEVLNFYLQPYLYNKDSLYVNGLLLTNALIIAAEKLTSFSSELVADQNPLTPLETARAVSPITSLSIPKSP